eukprot:CAMPEP_0197664902 /NCGR_PEP_ID=MMETSP1338-20131121/58915_1 /TAXON_ID=43686 ORGANISM="Pelagodinium beii, Strain RCC1491" /NCGR_SAMPLE_ID=MMETSP1338 /ASSEMBLY_ACC=CAM_ASM_000754 /LENGTH=560 /DNA_ID=CAMNT_0043243633 /DNA_START=47 /DNA_END=1726 /DNA_ORIENTATION=+
MSAQDALRLLLESDACRDQRDMKGCQISAENALSCYRGLLDAKGEAGAWRRILAARLGQNQVTPAAARELVMKELQRMGDSPGPKAILLLSLGEVDLLLGQVDKALAAGLEARSLFAALNDLEMEAYTCHAVLVHAYLKLARPKDAMESAQQAVSLAQQAQCKTEEAKSWQALGATRLAMGSDDAIAAMERALVLYKELGRKHSEAGLLTMLADSECHAGKGDAALARGLEALELARELQVSGYETPALDVVFRIACAMPQEAQKRAQDFLRLAQTSSEVTGTALMMGVHLGLQNPNAAFQLGQTLAKKLDERGDKDNLARMLTYVAALTSDLEEALAAAQRSLSIFQTSGDLSGQGMAKKVLDGVYGQRQQCSRAPNRKLAKQALARFGAALKDQDIAAFQSAMKCVDGYMKILLPEEIQATVDVAMAENPEAIKEFMRKAGCDGKNTAPAENQGVQEDAAVAYASARSSGMNHGPRFRTMCSSYRKGDDQAMAILQRDQEELLDDAWKDCEINDSLLEAAVFTALNQLPSKKASQLLVDVAESGATALFHPTEMARDS